MRPRRYACQNYFRDLNLWSLARDFIWRSFNSNGRAVMIYQINSLTMSVVEAMFYIRPLQKNTNIYVYRGVPHRQQINEVTLTPVPRNDRSLVQQQAKILYTKLAV